MIINRLVHGNPKKSEQPKTPKKTEDKKSSSYLAKCECGEEFLFEKEDGIIEKTKYIGTFVNIKCPCCGQNHSLEINATISESYKESLLDNKFLHRFKFTD